MDLILSIFSGVQAHMLIAFSKVNYPAICQRNRPTSSSSSLISEGLKLSASPYANPLCNWLTRCSSEGWMSVFGTKRTSRRAQALTSHDRALCHTLSNCANVLAFDGFCGGV